jgi:hypothetical protein
MLSVDLKRDSGGPLQVILEGFIVRETPTPGTVVRV